MQFIRIIKAEIFYSDATMGLHLIFICSFGHLLLIEYFSYQFDEFKLENYVNFLEIPKKK